MKKKLSRKEREKILSYLEDRYGLTKDQFKGLGLFKTQRKIYITTQECLNDPLFGKAEEGEGFKGEILLEKADKLVYLD